MPSPSMLYGAPSRGVTASDVDRAADALLRAGHRPTIDKVREKFGSGSPNTINPLLDAWWKRLSARLDAGPAALHRLPETVAHVAEALWLQALDEGRRRAAQEQQGGLRTLGKEKQDLEVRSYVLTLREGELDARLRDKERMQSLLESQLQELTVQLRKEQAATSAQERRIAELMGQREEQRRQIANFLAAAVTKQRSRNSVRSLSPPTPKASLLARRPRPSKLTKTRTPSKRKATGSVKRATPLGSRTTERPPKTRKRR